MATNEKPAETPKPKLQIVTDDPVAKNCLLYTHKSLELIRGEQATKIEALEKKIDDQLKEIADLETKIEKNKNDTEEKIKKFQDRLNVFFEMVSEAASKSK